VIVNVVVLVAASRLTTKLRHSRRKATVTGANDFMKTKTHTKLEGQRLLPAAPLLGINGNIYINLISSDPCQPSLAECMNSLLDDYLRNRRKANPSPPRPHRDNTTPNSAATSPQPSQREKPAASHSRRQRKASKYQRLSLMPNVQSSGTRGG
jgi:hypothetical protein